MSKLITAKQIALAIPFFCVATVSMSGELDLSQCLGIATDPERLKCYDEMSDYSSDAPHTDNLAAADLNSNADQKLSGEQWHYSEDTSALDNRKDVWLSVKSNNTEGNSIGSPIRATLWLRCMENKTNALIAFDRYTTEDQSVKFKLDDGPVQKQWMTTMRGGDGIGIWSGSRAIPFIRKILGKEQLVVGYDTYTSAVEFTFDISGLRARIDVLAKQCSWTP